MSTSSVDGFSEAVIDACEIAIRSQDSVAEFPERLYHFTDLDGFHGIIASRSLWSSAATALNDAAEIRYGVGLAIGVVAQKLDRASGFEREYLERLRECLATPSAAHFGMSYEIECFVVSFCGRCDRASQWLHYGRSGTGVVLGFAPRLAATVGRDLVRVDYILGSQIGRLAALVDVGRRQGSTRASEPWAAEAAAHIVSIHTPVAAVRLKHPAFADEEEIRVVGLELTLNGKSMTSPAGAIKTRVRGEAQVLYEELSFGSDVAVLEEVVVGYSTQVELGDIERSLIEAGLSANVRRSDVPVRPTV